MGDAELPPPLDPRIGKVLQGRYRILSKIASGAMGVVYRAERVQLDRPVAIKFLHPWIAAQKAFLSRFENEARAMSRLIHPHCVSVIDFGVDGAPFLVMDFVTGGTLRDLMLQGRVPAGRALRIVQQLLAGLAHAHAQGIVHRDLKPENLMLGDEAGLEEHLRILDFGLAKLRDGPAMTAGLAVGTPSYMSPEQSGAAGAIDARTDLYAVGIVLFEMLTERKPFVSENIADLIRMQREAPPPPLRETTPGAKYSLALEGLVAKAMAKHPDARFQSAGEMAAALETIPEWRALSGPPPEARPASVRPVPAGKTTVDTVSAVRRRLAVDDVKPIPTPLRQWRLAVVGGGFVVIAVLALLMGRSLRPNTATPKLVAPSSVAPSSIAPSSIAPSSVAPPTHAAQSPPASRPPDRPLPVASRPAPAPAGVAAPAPTPTPPATARSGGESPRLEQARQLIAARQIDQALVLLAELRTAEPDNADVPYLQAMLYLDKRRWAEGLGAAEVSVRKDPLLKTDPDLIKAILHSLVSDRGYQRSQAFLRTLGKAAVPFIRESAQRDPNPTVRQRAAELLGGSNARIWPARSSGSSLFKR